MANDVEIRVTAKDQSAPGIDSAKKNVKGLGDSFKKMGEIAGGILTAELFQEVGQAAGAFIKSTTKAASDLDESANAVNVTFGDSKQQITDWGRNNAAQFGLSQASFNKMAVPLGAMLKNTGLDMGVVSKSTIDLTERAADMASVFNTDVDEALTAIQAGLRGEADPLERFGVGLNAAAVEARALADTGKTSAAALTEQEKAMARVNLILEQTSSTQGDFANTSDGAANAQRIMTATFEESQAIIGQIWLPIMAEVMGVVTTVLEKFNSLPGPVQAVSGGIIILGAALTTIIPRIAATGAALATMGLTAERSGKALKATGSFLGGPWGIAIGVAVAAVAAFTLTKGEGVKASQEFTDTLDIETGALTKNSRMVALRAAEEEGLLDTLREAGLTYREITDALTGNEDAQKKVIATLREGGPEYHGMGEALSELQGKSTDAESKFRDLAQSFALSREDAAALREEEGNLASASEKAAEASEELQAQVDEQNKSMKEAADAVLRARDAEVNYHASLQDSKEALKENGATLDVTTEKGRENRTTLDAQAEATRRLISDNELSRAEFLKVRTSLRDTAEQFGMTEAEAEAYVRELLNIPRKVSTDVAVNTAQARREIAELNRQLQNVLRGAGAGQGFSQFNEHGGLVGGMAHGGIAGMQAGGPAPGTGMTWVGEGGPELVQLPVGSKVFPNGTSQRLAGGGIGGGSDRIVLEFRSDGSRISDLLVELMQQAVQVRFGGDVNRMFQ